MSFCWFCHEVAQYLFSVTCNYGVQVHNAVGYLVPEKQSFHFFSCKLEGFCPAVRVQLDFQFPRYCIKVLLCIAMVVNSVAGLQ